MTIVDQASRLWWERLPAGTARFSRGLAAALGDGVHLSAWPLPGAVAPPAAMVAGLLIGWLHFSPGETYTYSLPVMGVMLAVGVLGAGLGAWLLAGYAAGDLLLHPHLAFDVVENPVLQLLRVRVPLLLSYVLLAQLVVSIPLVAATIRRGLPARLGPGRPVIGYGLGTAVMGVLVFLWSQAVPSLIRPVYTWQDAPPPIEAIQPLQELGWVLVFLAVAAMVVRITLETAAGRRVAAREARLGAAIARPPGAGHLRSPLRAAVRAGLTGLLLAGIVDNPFEAIVLIAILFALFWARDLVQAVLPAWARLVSRVPVLLRLAAGVAVSFLVATQTVNVLWTATDSFLPILLSVVLSLLAFAVLIPPVRQQARP